MFHLKHHKNWKCPQVSWVYTRKDKHRTLTSTFPMAMSIQEVAKGSQHSLSWIQYETFIHSSPSSYDQLELAHVKKSICYCKSIKAFLVQQYQNVWCIICFLSFQWYFWGRLFLSDFICQKLTVTFSVCWAVFFGVPSESRQWSQCSPNCCFWSYLCNWDRLVLGC